MAAAVASASDAQLASGTPACMAPLRPSAARRQRRSMDIYSAALVLVELLTGRPLIHQSDTWQALYRIANETLVLPEDLGPGVDDALRAILLRALARDPRRALCRPRIFVMHCAPGLPRPAHPRRRATPRSTFCCGACRPKPSQRCPIRWRASSGVASSEERRHQRSDALDPQGRGARTSSARLVNSVTHCPCQPGAR